MDQKEIDWFSTKHFGLAEFLQYFKHTEVGDAEKYSIQRLKISSSSIIKITKMHQFHPPPSIRNYI